MYVNNGGNRKGIGFQRVRTPYNPHSRYVTVPDNWLCIHCGNNGHFKENCQARVMSLQKNKAFAKKVTAKRGPGTHKNACYLLGLKEYLFILLLTTRDPNLLGFLNLTSDLLVHGIVKGSSQQWYMDSGCSKHMTGNTVDFLSLKALQGGSVSFGNGKKGLLSVSQICDKGNKVEFVSKICTVTSLVTGEVVLVAKRYKNIYVADFNSLQSGNLSCLKAVDDDAELWHRRFVHASFSLLNKLIQKDLVRGLPMSKFKEQKVCDSCAREKHMKSSFKSKKDANTSKLFFIWICVAL
ncbi:uncharacterized protein [Nicotiana sylvestris]|uniref:uncharacterized protein n=1 Tax=Nicotiana sylvestris TaxID=4096 RepID=UPI00388CE230